MLLKARVGCYVAITLMQVILEVFTGMKAYDSERADPELVRIGLCNNVVCIPNIRP